MAPSNPDHAGTLPDIDDHLSPPDALCEIWDGEVIEPVPADRPHAQRHAKVLALVEAHTQPAFQVGSDLLTRTSRNRDIAPDVSVFPAAPDPVTGRRQLDHVSFEIVSTVSLNTTGKRAAELMKRGVRRVFAIDVPRSRVLEWSAELATWSPLDPSGWIDDPVFAVPLPLRELVTAGTPDNAVARALIDRGNPVIDQMRAQDRASAEQAGKQQGLAEGKHQGLIEGKRNGLLDGQRVAIVAVLGARQLALKPAEVARIFEEDDADQIVAWLRLAATCARASELFDER